MQTQYALKQAGLTLPVTKEFQQHITTLLANQVLQKITEAVVINFRDPDYRQPPGAVITLIYGVSVRIMTGILIMSQILVIWGVSTLSWKKKLIFAGRGIMSSII